MNSTGPLWRFVAAAACCLFTACGPPPFAPPVTAVDADIERRYYQTAVGLYLEEIRADREHPNYDDPQIDSAGVWRYLEIIQYLADTGGADMDSILHVYRVKDEYCDVEKSYRVLVNPDSPIIQNMIAHVDSTGDGALDQLLAAYGFNRVYIPYSYNRDNYLTLITPTAYNEIALSKILRESQHIQDVRTGGCIRNGDEVTAKWTRDSVTVKFSFGEGDCMGGCIFRKNWTYVVDRRGTRLISKTERGRFHSHYLEYRRLY